MFNAVYVIPRFEILQRSDAADFTAGGTSAVHMGGCLKNSQQ